MPGFYFCLSCIGEHRQEKDGWIWAWLLFGTLDSTPGSFVPRPRLKNQEATGQVGEGERVRG